MSFWRAMTLCEKYFGQKGKIDDVMEQTSNGICRPWNEREQVPRVS